MIEAAAAAHRVFLQRPQSRRGLARADDARLGVRDALREDRGRGGDAGEMAEEIERNALGAENGARIAGNRHQFGSWPRSSSPSRACGLDFDVGRQPAECRDDQRQAGDHAGFARVEHGAAVGILRHRCGRGDVAGAAEIFLERAVHRRFDLERGQKRVGAQKRYCGIGVVRHGRLRIGAEEQRHGREIHSHCRRRWQTHAAATRAAMRRRVVAGRSFRLGGSRPRFMLRGFLNSNSRPGRHEHQFQHCRGQDRRFWRTPAAGHRLRLPDRDDGVWAALDARLFPHAAVERQSLGPRRIRLCAGVAEFAVGHRPAARAASSPTASAPCGCCAPARCCTPPALR